MAREILGIPERAVRMILQSLDGGRLWRASVDPSYDLFVEDFWTRPEPQVDLKAFNDY